MRTLLLAAVAVTLAAGCGPQPIKKVNLSGTATYKGQKLTGGLLKVVSAGGEYAAGVVQADGTYTITDVIPGQIKVGIVPSPQGSGSSDGSKTPKASRSAVDLPAKFMDPETSGVVYTVTDDTTTLDIEFK